MYMCASQDWDTEGKDRGTVQLTGSGSGVCVCVCTEMGAERSCNFCNWLRETDHRKNAGKGYKGIGDPCEKGKRRGHYMPRWQKNSGHCVSKNWKEQK